MLAQMSHPAKRSPQARKSRAHLRAVRRPARAPRLSLDSLYELDAAERHELVKEGVPATMVDRVSEDMAIGKGKLYETLGLAPATVNRKLRSAQLLSPNESERLLGITRLIGQVERIVRESGDATGFRAAEWMAAWLERPHAALGGRPPAELMDTADGRDIVSDLVARLQSSAYA